MKDELVFASERLKANDDNMIQTVKDVCDEYGYGLVDAKKIVDLAKNEKSKFEKEKKIQKKIETDKLDIEKLKEKEQKKYEKLRVKQEKKEQVRLEKEKKIEQQVKRKNKKTENNYNVPKRIIKTIVVANDSQKKITSAVGRAAIGEVLLGPAGLLAGVTAKSKNTTTFKVIYSDGTSSIETVKNSSNLFEKYCSFLEN